MLLPYFLKLLHAKSDGTRHETPRIAIAILILLVMEIVKVIVILRVRLIVRIRVIVTLIVIFIVTQGQTNNSSFVNISLHQWYQ